jgi:hypothetical protein
MNTLLQRLLERGGRTVGQIREAQPATVLCPCGESPEHAVEISRPPSPAPAVPDLLPEPHLQAEQLGILEPARINLSTADSERRPTSTLPRFLPEAGVREREQARSGPPSHARVEPRQPAQDIGLADAAQARGRWRSLHARLLEAHPPRAYQQRIEPQACPAAGETEAAIAALDDSSRPASIRAAAPASMAPRDNPLVEGPAAGEPRVPDPPEVVIQNLEVRVLSNSVPPRPLPNPTGGAAAQSRGAWTVVARGYLGRL